MIYRRTFRFSAAHFNSRASYETAWSKGPRTREQTDAALLDIHGHNFRVDIHIAGDLLGYWIVDDIELEKIVKEYDGINLSMHPDFLEQRQRATTERIALNLLTKLRDRFNTNQILQVEVWETDDVYAMAR